MSVKYLHYLNDFVENIAQNKKIIYLKDLFYCMNEIIKNNLNITC